MPNLTTATDQSIAALIFNATSWTSLAVNATSSPATVLYISLHNADPGAAGNQSTSETVYTNYIRVSVARNSSGFTVGSSAPISVSNAGAINFAQCGATGDTLTHFGIGLASTGSGTLLLSGPIGTSGPYDFTCTNASPGIMTIPGTALSVNNRLCVYANAAGTLPTGFTEGVTYYVGTVTGIAVSLSTTASNANPVNTSGVGAGFAMVQSPLIVSNGITPQFASNSLLNYWS
jgi:hypothetical protein